MIRYTILLTVIFLACWQINAQGIDYLKEANACFEKGDYECAKKNYTLFQTFDGKDMSAYIKKAEDCMRTRNLADDYFGEKEYEKAKARYRTVLEHNPKDPYVQKKYDACVIQLNAIISNSQTPQVSTSPAKNHPAEPEMVFVEGGTFWMGCSGEDGSECSEAEIPLHSVTVSSFNISIYPVTQKQWQLLMGTTVRQQRDKDKKKWPINGEGDNYPMYYINWGEAQEFIRRLNEATGKQYRLLTEAEWEYAARGGNKSKGYKYSGSNNLNDVGWYSENSGNSIHPVGTKRPNELGIYDMSGNVWEWCQDWYGNYSSQSQNNPKGPNTGTDRVLRGGRFADSDSFSRVTRRGNRSPNERFYTYGFRIALSE